MRAAKLNEWVKKAEVDRVGGFKSPGDYATFEFPPLSRHDPFLAGLWVVGLAAAALSVRGLTTALVVLRGAFIRTGIGALVVSAKHWT